MSTLPAKILNACLCCSTGLDHCPHCHDVPIHGVTVFNYVSVVQGIPVYWGTDQQSALDSARRGAGYVTISPILADFRELAGRHDFQPVLATPFGDAVVPLDAVRSRRNTDGAGFDYQRPDPAEAAIDWDAAFARSVTAGDPDSYICPARGQSGVATCPCHGQTPTETAPGSTESVQHAEGIPEAPLRLNLP